MYRGCPHGKAHQEPCDQCIGFFRGHLELQASKVRDDEIAAEREAAHRAELADLKARDEALRSVRLQKLRETRAARLARKAKRGLH